MYANFGDLVVWCRTYMGWSWWIYPSIYTMKMMMFVEKQEKTQKVQNDCMWNGYEMDLDAAAAAASGQKKSECYSWQMLYWRKQQQWWWWLLRLFLLFYTEGTFVYAQKSYIHRVTKISLTTHVIFKRIFRIKMKFFHLLFFTLGKEFLLHLLVFSFYFIFHFVRLFALYKNVIHM